MSEKRSRKARGRPRQGVRRARRRPALLAVLAVGLLSAGWFLLRPAAPPGPPPPPADLPAPPQPVLTDMEVQVRALLTQRRDEVVADPGSARAWGRYGIACDAHDLHGPASECYRVAGRLDPQEFRWAYFLARVVEILGGEADEVLALHDEALALRPAYAPAHVRHGDALLRAGRAKEALAAFDRALAIDPRLPRAHRGRGQALLSLDDVPGARAELEMAVQYEPDDGTAWSFLARALLRAGDRAGARAAQAKARELPSTHVMDDAVLGEIGQTAISADACLRRADKRMRSGEYRSAIQDLIIVLSVRPHDAPARFRLGSAYTRVGRVAEALAVYQAVLVDAPDYVEGHRGYAEALMVAGRPEEAVTHWRRVEELAGPDTAATARLASALAQAGRLDEALGEFERAAALGPLTAADQNNRGSALAQAGRNAEAESAFEAALRLDPDLASAHFNLSMLQESAGKHEEAAYHLQRAAQLDPHGPAAKRMNTRSVLGKSSN